MASLDVEIPESWCQAKALEVCSVLVDCHNKTAPYKESGIKLVRTSNIRNGQLNLDDVKFVDDETYEYWSRRCKPKPGDLLFTREAPMGEAGMIPPNERICMGQRMLLLRANEDCLVNQFLLHFLQSPYLRSYIERTAVGTGVKHLRVRDVNDLPITLPPLNEQHRIVKKIETLTTHSRKAREALDAIPPLLDQFRQSVLAAAFRGDLTADWRAENPDAESGEKLLERMREDKRIRWEINELTKMKLRGKIPKNDNWKKKYSPLSLELDLDVLPVLPTGWCWSFLDDVTENFDSIRVPIKASDRKTMRGDYAYYGAFGVIDYINKYLFDGDYLLLAEDGKNLYYRNKPIAFQASGQFWVNNHSHVMQTLAGMPLSYLENYLNSVDLTSYLSGTDQVKLTRTSMNKIPVPVAPFQEQQIIMQILKRLLNLELTLSMQSSESNKELLQLDQSILAKAFRGELVPQDPTDEPATHLLNRIRTERAKTQKTKKKTQRKKKS